MSAFHISSTIAAYENSHMLTCSHIAKWRVARGSVQGFFIEVQCNRDYKKVNMIAACLKVRSHSQLHSRSLWSLPQSWDGGVMPSEEWLEEKCLKLPIIYRPHAIEVHTRVNTCV